MIKDVKPYKQKGLTSVVSCMLMILSYYKKCNANWFNERKYYSLYKSYYYDGTPASAMAWHFRKNDLETIMFHSEKNYFKRPSYLKEKEFKKLLDEYKLFLNGAKKIGCEVETEVNIDCEFLRNKLNDDYIILLSGTSGKYLHSVVVCGYEDDSFIICDPLYKRRKSKSIDEMNAFMNNEYGISCICVRGMSENE